MMMPALPDDRARTDSRAVASGGALDGGGESGTRPASSLVSSADVGSGHEGRAPIVLSLSATASGAAKPKVWRERENLCVGTSARRHRGCVVLVHRDTDPFVPAPHRVTRDRSRRIACAVDDERRRRGSADRRGREARRDRGQGRGPQGRPRTRGSAPDRVLRRARRHLVRRLRSVRATRRVPISLQEVRQPRRLRVVLRPWRSVPNEFLAYWSSDTKRVLWGIVSHRAREPVVYPSQASGTAATGRWRTRSTSRSCRPTRRSIIS
mmetsp:Transcript_19805/g.78893  ORF Transcript_19805/g.78893 Transcript_19805/m.78893 type:complete len:266 (-) Transcript_19805:310-1107(-)